MSGKVKAGEGMLIGHAGEHYVMAELLRRSVVAALAPRNAPAFDILATKGEHTVRIRVKTKSAEYVNWQWVVKKDGSIFRNLAAKGDFTILVNLSRRTEDLEFFIIPTQVVNQWLINAFHRWVTTPGKYDQQRNQNNPKRHLNQNQHAKQLEEYRNNWDILWSTENIDTW